MKTNTEPKHMPTPLDKVHQAIDRIRMREIDKSSGGIRVEGRRYEEAFNQCVLIAQEAKPEIIRACGERAALVAVAEAAKLVLETPEPMTATEHFDYSANSQRLLKSALVNLAAVRGNK